MSANSVAFIYALLDPRDNVVRYVGKTIQTIERRLNEHCIDCNKVDTYRARWIRKLLRQGVRPKIMLLETVSVLNWEEAERRWIRHFKELSVLLTNATNGGEKEKEYTPESRQRMSQAQMDAIQRLKREGVQHWNKGRVHTSESRARMGAAAKGRPSPNKGKRASREAVEKMRLARLGKPNLKLRGRKYSAETIEKMRAAKLGKPSGARGKKWSLESRLKASLVRKGRVPWNKGKKMPPEVGERLSALLKGKPGRNKGKKFSAQACANIAAAHRGKRPNLSAETRAKLRAAANRRWAKARGEETQLPLDI